MVPLRLIAPFAVPESASVVAVVETPSPKTMLFTVGLWPRMSNVPPSIVRFPDVGNAADAFSEIVPAFIVVVPV